MKRGKNILIHVAGIRKDGSDAPLKTVILQVMRPNFPDKISNIKLERSRKRNGFVITWDDIQQKTPFEYVIDVDKRHRVSFSSRSKSKRFYEVPKEISEGAHIMTIFLQSGGEEFSKTTFEFSIPKQSNSTEGLRMALNNSRDWELDFKQIFKPLIEKGGDPNIRDKHGNSLLLYFCGKIKRSQSQEDILEIVKYLFEKGADATVSDGRFSALHKAVESNNTELVSILLKHNADPNYTAECLPLNNCYGRSPAIVSALLSAGANPDGDGKRTPLWHICRFGSASDSPDAIEVLLKAGADPNKHVYDSPLYEAISNKYDSAWVEILVRNKASISFINRDGDTLLHAAVKRRFTRRKNDTENHTLKIASFLLARGVPIDKKNNKGQTPWMSYCESHYNDSDFNFIKFFVENGVELHPHGCKTVLEQYFVCPSQNYKISEVQYLLSKGCKVNIFYKKPPILSVLSQRTLDIFQLFIDSGADLSYKDNKGNTLLHIAAQRGDIKIVEILLKKGMSPSLQNNAGRTPAQMSRNKKMRALIESWGQHEIAE